MEYAKQINGEWQQYTLRQLRKDNPQVSFPVEPTDNLLAAYGLYPVQVEAQPSYDPRYQRLVQSSLTEANGVVTRGWVVEDIPATAERVKAEAYRRIVAICPEWKQRNLTAQAAQLAKKGEANWTPEEAAAWAAGEALWVQIAAIRAASDVIEAMDPIPANFYDLPEWPD
jgi:hypothetical protein